MAGDSREKQVRCSFCGLPQERVKVMFGRSGAYICDECVKLCVETLDDKDPATAKKSRKNKNNQRTYCGFNTYYNIIFDFQKSKSKRFYIWNF